MGHLYEMIQGSGVEAFIDTSRISIFPEALECAKMGILPEGMYRNRSFAQQYVDCGEVPLYIQDALFDPQTSGGLLIAVHPDDADDLEREMKPAVPCLQRIGTVSKAENALIHLIK